MSLFQCIEVTLEVRPVDTFGFLCEWLNKNKPPVNSPNLTVDSVLEGFDIKLDDYVNIHRKDFLGARKFENVLMLILSKAIYQY